MNYYTGDSVPLKFTLADSLGPVLPSTATVVIKKPSNGKTAPVSATVQSNAVSYTVPGTVTSEPGIYEAYFVNTLSYGERTHRIDFTVIINPG